MSNGFIPELCIMLSLLRSLLSRQPKIPATIYDFKVPTLNGGTIDFAAFRGKKILIVNTASRCGFTPQYEGLEKLYQQYRDKLVIVGFPANNFLFQEPGSNSDIASFCSLNYHITFPMATKVSVLGWNKAPIYRWLTKKKYNHLADSIVKWNFQKYLINEQGQLIAIFPPSAAPLSPEIIAAIEKINK
jgi:glutathione peroxidase